MASDAKLEARILTPEGEVYAGELFQLSTRTSVGEVGIRARHAPMIARVVPAELRLHGAEGDSDVQRYATGEGWLEVFANKATLLVAEATDPSELDVSSLKERLDEAEQKLKDAEEGSAAEEQAKRDKLRAEAFIKIAEKS